MATKRRRNSDATRAERIDELFRKKGTGKSIPEFTQMCIDLGVWETEFFDDAAYHKAYKEVERRISMKRAGTQLPLGMFAAPDWVGPETTAVVCQRTKGSGMRWRRLGAQAILNLRCKWLAAPRWSEFFATRPCWRRPPVHTLRKVVPDRAA